MISHWSSYKNHSLQPSPDTVPNVSGNALKIAQNIKMQLLSPVRKDKQKRSGLRSAAQTPGEPLRLLWCAPSPSVMNSGVVPSELESRSLEVVRLNDGSNFLRSLSCFSFSFWFFVPRRSDHRSAQQKTHKPLTCQANTSVSKRRGNKSGILPSYHLNQNYPLTFC